MNLLKKSFVTLGIVSLAGTAMAEVKQPLEVVNRPLTTPAGQVEAGASLGFLFFKDANGDSVRNPHLKLSLPQGDDTCRSNHRQA